MNWDTKHEIWDTQCPICKDWFKKYGLTAHMNKRHPKGLRKYTFKGKHYLKNK